MHMELWSVTLGLSGVLLSFILILTQSHLNLRNPCSSIVVVVALFILWKSLYYSSSSGSRCSLTFRWYTALETQSSLAVDRKERNLKNWTSLWSWSCSIELKHRQRALWKDWIPGYKEFFDMVGPAEMRRVGEKGEGFHQELGIRNQEPGMYIGISLSLRCWDIWVLSLTAADSESDTTFLFLYKYTCIWACVRSDHEVRGTRWFFFWKCGCYPCSRFSRPHCFPSRASW